MLLPSVVNNRLWLITTIDTSAAELFDALLHSQEIDGVVKLKDSNGNCRHFPVEEHDTLLVRKADRHLWRFFSKVVVDGEIIDGVHAFKQMIVVGPEGVGKV